MKVAMAGDAHSYGAEDEFIERLRTEFTGVEFQPARTEEVPVEEVSV